MITRSDARFAALRDQGRAALVTFVTAGDPDLATSLAILQALPGAGRSIDEDHYGASFPYYFGRESDSVVGGVMAAYAKRTGRDARRQFAIGDEKAVLDRVAEYVEGGVQKFILRPIGSGEQVLAQTRLLIDQVLPQVGTRWPKPAKAA